MLNKLRLGFRELHFWHQLAIVYGLGILVLALITSVVVSSISSSSVRTQLVSQGMQVAESLATQSKVALLYRSSDIAAEVAGATLNFPDVNGAGIFTLQGEPVFTTLLGAEIGTVPFDPAVDSVTLLKETDSSWTFSAPVSVGAINDPYDLGFEAENNHELIGFVLVEMSKDSLQALGFRILQSNILASMVVASVLLLLLIAWSRRLTSPLERLSHLMHRACEGEEWLRADVGGAKDIAAMQEAFNTMMASLERRNMELLHARDVALDSARTKGEFAANVSHELRTPMNGILGMLDLLATMGLTHKQQEYVVTARRSGESLLALIDDILSFSKVDAGMLSLDPGDCHIEEVLDEVMALIGNEALRKSLEVGYVIATDVTRLVHLDSAKLRQVLVNLGGNAVKFTEEGEVAIRVDKIAPPGQEEMLRFEIRDTGVGIPADAQSQVFQAFTQADASLTRTYGGTGLGLAIAKELVNIMGGDIRLTSQLGGGSVFCFTLPLQEPIAMPAVPLPAALDTARYQVVVIESCSLIVEFLKTELINLGIEALYFERGIEGLNYLRALQDQPAVVLVGEHTRDLKAVDVVTLLEQQIAADQIIPVVLRNPWSSGFKEGQVGQVRFLNKPLRSQKVFELLTSIVQGQAQEIEPTDYSQQPLGFDVLVVDDNHSNQLVAVGMLEKLGCDTTVARSGKEAFEAATRKHFDLILMDCQMPVMDGFEATRQIRRLEYNGPHTVIIAMTANNRSEDVRKCLDSGMDDFLGKPLRLDTLREKILHWLSSPLSLHVGETEGGMLQPESTEIFDSAVVAELRKSVGEVFGAMLRAFLEDTPVYLSSMKLAAAEGKWLQVRDLAHTIKGSAVNFGARRVVDLARRIQENADREVKSDYRAVIQELEKAFAHLKRALESLESGTQTGLDGKPNHFRILVVDDDRSMRIALTNAVTQDGYVMEQASNGQHALVLCQRQMPDLILMDALMPEMDGFTACRRIREMPGGSDVPILMITGLEDENSIVRAFSAGATDYVPKPVHFVVLRQRMARLLQASKAEQHVRKLAYFDPLTGLPNRTNLLQTLRVALNRAVINQSMVAMLFLDLDRFKLINDTLGHDAGDLLLKAVADRIRRCVRESDFVARLGGDEFTVVLEDMDSLEHIANVAEKICESLSSPFVFLQQKMFLSVSIGISLFPNDADDVTTLLKHADSAMFRAKESRNHYSFYKHGMEDEIAQRIELENDLRQAVADDALSLYFQPQFRSTDNRLIGAEALLRWNHPKLGLLTPDKFVPLAEESTLINDIGLMVVRKASRQAHSWHKRGHRLRVSVNLSARDIQAVGMKDRLNEIIRQEGVDPAMLEFEITETVLLENPDQMIEELRSLRNMGITLAIDDFGSGYSSLNYLRRLPVDLIKIDRSFIVDLDKGQANKSLLEGIIALTHSMGMETMAEGVETQVQRDLLVQLGCDYLQGYYFAKPLRVDEFEQQFLDNGRSRHLTVVN